MGTSTRQATSGLTSQKNELTKSFAVYDADGRPTTIYTAPYLVGDQGACTQVDYTYTSPTSTLVEKMRESNGVWLAAYDI